MFKKTLVAVAALAAFGSSYAANFTLYGTVDEGLFYSYERAKDSDGVERDNSLKLSSGINAASKFGLKGTEDLGNGLKVGFKLENQFSADTGTLTEGLLFRREASLSVYSDYGTLSMGRMGGVGSSAGTYDIVYGIGDAFDGFDNDIGGLAMSARYDNMVTYQTPKFGGVQATVQYSFKTKGAEDKQSSKNQQYAGAALSGEFGPFNAVVAYEYLNRAADEGTQNNGHTVYLGANYNCGFATTFGMVQYFKGVESAFGLDATEFYTDEDDETIGQSEGFTGFGMTVGTQFSVAGGDTTVAVYYADGKLKQMTPIAGDTVYTNAAYDCDASYLGLSARYVYPLSKRTSVYVGGGMARAKLDVQDETEKATIGQAYLGLTHQF